MEKNAVLKIVNPMLAILMLNQPLSAFLSEVTGWDLFEGLHILGGVLLLCAAAVHLALNWKWVEMNLLKNRRKQEIRSLTKGKCDFVVTLLSDVRPYPGISSIQPGSPFRYVHVVREPSSLNSRPILFTEGNEVPNFSFIDVHD
jgi:hypothetical protein